LKVIQNQVIFILKKKNEFNPSTFETSHQASLTSFLSSPLVLVQGMIPEKVDSLFCANNKLSNGHTDVHSL
jgi:hypothetical protein